MLTTDTLKSHSASQYCLTMFPVMSPINDSKREPSWTDVLVAGEFCQDESDMHQAGLLQLCGHARAVFACRPARLFLHGFYMASTCVEAWRSSGYLTDRACNCTAARCHIFGSQSVKEARTGLDRLLTTLSPSKVFIYTYLIFVKMYNKETTTP